ncbi:MAG: ABC transporter substrate binding protein, partial [Patescibacteria group bacterium]|nr:ABC transporter substrate binding protein [Patescibacteria group bacterium]
RVRASCRKSWRQRGALGGAGGNRHRKKWDERRRIHRKIGEFEQLTQYTLLDKFQQWGEKIASYQHQKPLSVMVIYSEKAPYEEAIVNSLFEHLDNKVWHLEQAVHDEPFVGPDGTKDIANWQKKIDKIIQRTFSHKVDYLVTVGTNVTIAIRDAKLADKFNAKGVIFLGLTDPVKAGIVKSLNDRHEDNKITGVRYGTDNEDDYGKTIGALFPPQQKLVFVYNKHTIQDVYVDQNLSKLKEKTNDMRFESRPKDGDITLNDLAPKQPNAPQEVYFAWYGLDNVLRDNEKDDGLAALKTKWVIPSTYSTDNLEKAGVVVSVSDQEVGRLGAEIIFKSYLNPDLKLGEEPVATTPFVAWLDCEVIRQNKVGLRLATPIPETAKITNKDACSSLTQ